MTGLTLYLLSGLAPEIAMWRLFTDEKGLEEDWYIKPNVYVPLEACCQNKDGCVADGTIATMS